MAVGLPTVLFPSSCVLNNSDVGLPTSPVALQNLTSHCDFASSSYEDMFEKLLLAWQTPQSGKWLFMINLVWSHVVVLLATPVSSEAQT